VFGVPDPEEEGDWIIPVEWLAVWNISSSVGIMLGSITAGRIGDILGRRKMLLGSTVFSAFANTICFISDRAETFNGRRGVFFLGKTVQGIAIGAINSTVQTYMSETVPTKLRGSILAFFPIFQLVGQILGAVVVQTQIDNESRSAYRLCFILMWPFCFLPAVLSLILPESPVWLIRKGRIEAALRCHERLLGPFRRSLIRRKVAVEKLEAARPQLARDFDRLQATLKSEAEAVKDHAGQQVDVEDAVGYKAAFNKQNIRRTLIVVFASMLPELFGGHLVGNAGYFLQQVGVDPSTANMFFIIGIALALVSNIGSFYTTSRFGRRTLTWPSLSIITIMWLLIGIIGSTPSETLIKW
jgi:MFS family permease